jgi:hypothetical protein
MVTAASAPASPLRLQIEGARRARKCGAEKNEAEGGSDAGSKDVEIVHFT